MREEVALGPREGAADGHVQDHEEPVVRGVVPDVGRNPRRVDREVVEAVAAFRKVFELPQRPGNFEVSFDKAFQNLKLKLERLGLSVTAEPVSGLAVSAAD